MKKLIAADAFSYIFRAELGPLYANGHPPSVAIVPVREHGWATLTSHKDRKFHPQLAAQTAKIEKRLRLRYRLK
jgi:hypothetical protein